jgi:hypothetical protein
MPGNNRLGLTTNPCLSLTLEMINEDKGRFSKWYVEAKARKEVQQPLI